MKLKEAKRVAELFNLQVCNYVPIKGIYMITDNQHVVTMGVEVYNAKQLYQCCRRYIRQRDDDAIRESIWELQHGKT